MLFTITIYQSSFDLLQFTIHVRVLEVFIYLCNQSYNCVRELSTIMAGGREEEWGGLQYFGELMGAANF